MIIVDNEELGLWGSAAALKKLKKSGHNLKNKRIINLDCIGHGSIPIIIRNSSSYYKECALNYILRKFDNAKELKMILSASDNYIFKKYGALSILMTEKANFNGGYYIQNIHSKKDKLINFSQIDKLTGCIVEMIKSS